MITFKDELAMWVNLTDSWKTLIEDSSTYRRFQHHFFNGLKNEIFLEYDQKVGFNETKPLVKHTYGIATPFEVYKLEIMVGTLDMVPVIYNKHKMLYLEQTNVTDHEPIPGPSPF